MSTLVEQTHRRRFLGSQSGVLGSAAQWLVHQHLVDHGSGGELDMSGSIVVVPTGHAGRRLLERILDESLERSVALIPPEVTTIGTLPEKLYESKKPLASALLQRLAWVEALRRTPREQLEVFTRSVPDSEDTHAWLALGKVLAGWRHDLAGAALSFADVLHAGSEAGSFPERPRWELLCELENRYLELLTEKDVWDQQAARLVAIEQRECHTDRQIYLVGTADLNRTARAMLSQLSANVTALVFAGEDRADLFDDLGCLEIARWKETTIEIPESTIRVADQPGDQARIVSDFLSGLDEQFAVDDVVIALPDEKLAPQIGRSLAHMGLNTYDAGGRSLSESRPWIMLSLLSEWLADQRYESFASLVRHPDIFAWLSEQLGSETWLPMLDEVQNLRLPFFVPTRAQQSCFGDDPDRLTVRVHAHLAALVQPLLSPARTLPQWSQPWRRVLLEVYRQTRVDRGNQLQEELLQACLKIDQSLVELGKLDETWGQTYTSLAALDLALSQVADERLHREPQELAVPMLGWLDVPYDDAPVTVVTNVNDGFIPSFETSSLFLPNSLRTRLGLVDNDRRYARDAYALDLMVRSRERLLLISGRFDPDGQPLLPCRLLLTGEATSVARRAQRLFGDGETAREASLDILASRPVKQQLTIPEPQTAKATLTSLRVTDFESYMRCPYRFYLTRILNLERVADDADEMDAGQFGSLAHDIVEQFGRSEIKHSDKLPVVEGYLFEAIEQLARERFGSKPLPAVQVQLEQMRLRLGAFARWQIEHRRDGWEIHDVELKKLTHRFDLDGEPFEIRGQIDRIDIHPQRKRIGIFDYKTGDAGKDPERTHRSGQEWTNLQLPLYRWLAADLDLPEGCEVDLGFILLPKDTAHVSLRLSRWTEQELVEADLQAFDIMRRVRRGQFWPMSDGPMPPFLQPLDAVCQTRVFQRWTPEATRDGGPQ